MLVRSILALFGLWLLLGGCGVGLRPSAPPVPEVSPEPSSATDLGPGVDDGARADSGEPIDVQRAGARDAFRFRVLAPNGKPAEGAVVRTWLGRAGWPDVLFEPVPTVALGANEFSVESQLREGDVVAVRARLDGVGLGESRFRVGSSGGRQRQVSVESGQLVRGRVFGPDGSPVAGAAHVRLTRLRSGRSPIERHSEHVLTDADGVFELLALTYPSTHLVEVGLSGYGAVEPFDFDFEFWKRPVNDLGDLVLRRGLTHEGLVLLPSGEPLALPGAFVTALGPGRTVVDRTPLRADGSFLFRGLEPGPVRFEVSGPDGRVLPESRSPLMPAGGGDVLITALTAQVHRLDVRGVDLDGREVELESFDFHLDERPREGERRYRSVPSWKEGRDRSDHTVPAGTGLLLHGKDDSRRHYASYLPADVPAGRNVVQLQPDERRGPGELRVRLRGEQVSEPLVLTLGLSEASSGRRVQRELRLEPGARDRIVDGLPLGPFRVSAYCRSASPGTPEVTQVLAHGVEIDLFPDAIAEVEITVRSRARVVLEPVGRDRTGELEVAWRASGTTEWVRARLRHRDGAGPDTPFGVVRDALDTGREALLAGSFESGAYELRVRREGAPDFVAPFDAVAGRVTRVRLELDAGGGGRGPGNAGNGESER